MDHIAAFCAHFRPGLDSSSGNGITAALMATPSRVTLNGECVAAVSAVDKRAWRRRRRSPRGAGYCLPMNVWRSTTNGDPDGRTDRPRLQPRWMVAIDYY